MSNAWLLLSDGLRSRASFRGNEYAWKIADLTEVINDAKQANLVDVGGQLQFRLANAICECYWVEVNTYKTVSAKLPHSKRVTRTANIALNDLQAIRSKFDFSQEGRSNFDLLSPLDHDNA